VLLANDAAPNVVGYLLHQAIEKGLKAALLAHGLRARRVHDLDALLDDLVDHRPDAEAHRDLCLRAAGFHTAHRYPAAVPAAMDADQLEDLLEAAQAMLDDLQAGA
jgi:HEPN domain-containing protein